MSNKKRRNRKAESGTIGLELPGASADQTYLINEGRETESSLNISVPFSGQAGIIAYLKAHLWLAAAICFLALGALGAGLKYLDEDAQRELARRKQKTNLNDKHEQTFLNKINPFLPTPTPTPTPQLSKELIYAGPGRLLAVEDKNANAAPPADLAIWRPGDGSWWVMGGNGSQQVTTTWGASGDTAAPGDYDGDGKTDFAIFRPSTGYWWILRSSDNNYYSVPFGTTGDKVAAADYDGDGKTDLGLYRPDTSSHLGTWYINRSSDGGYTTVQFGADTDKPAAADYDGDGRADLAYYKGSTTTFYYLSSNSGSTVPQGSVAAGDVPVPGDYDGDGKADFGFWTGGSGSSSGSWKYYPSGGGSPVTVTIGIGTDTPIQNDYNGDGKTDMAIFRGANSPGQTDAGTWLIRNSGNPSPLRTEHWGAVGDIPVPALWKR